MTKETTTTIKLTYLRYFSTKTNQKTPAKRYNFVNGEVVKERMSMDACYRGETISITTAQELLDIYQNMDPADALTYGVSAKGHSEYVCVPVYRKEDIEEQIQQSKDINLPVISRTRSDFEYAKEPGILFIDMDGIVGNFEDDIDKIYDAIPELKAYPHVVSRSGSSYIQLPDGTAHSQVKGIHIVWMVENASNIPKYGKILFDRLTLKGYSQIELSKTGARLCRECGGNCRTAGSGHVTLAPVRPRGQGTSAREAERGFPSHRLFASGSALTPGAPRAASARFRRRAARSGS